MEIKIDTDKDSVESLQQVQKILRNKAKTNQERSIKRPKRQAEERSSLTGAEEFISAKYRYFILHTICKLCHREILGTEEYFEAGNDMRRDLRKNTKEELIIDEVSLFKEFVKFANNLNLPDVDPYIFQSTLKSMVGKACYEPVCLYIERVKGGNNNLLRVIF